MSTFETFVMSVKSIFSNKMRSFLTMLGIIIGVAAVMIIIGMGNGIQNYMTDSFAVLGTNTLAVTITSTSGSRSVSDDEMFDIAEEQSAYFEGVSPNVSVRGRLKIGSENLSTSVKGVSENFFMLKKLDIAEGRGLSFIDITDRKKVCVVGEYINREYFKGNAVGSTCRIGNEIYTIIGVIAQQDDEVEKNGNDNCAYVPYTTAARLSGQAVASYTFYLTDEELANEAADALGDIFYDIFGNDDSYSIITMSSILDIMLDLVNVVIKALAIIAGISLVVGGVGIMNIMLVSVTERTKEIGIRKALGAKESTIMTQFVMEAGVLSGMGGIFGIIFGYIMSDVGSRILVKVLEENIAITPSLGSIGIAFGISVGIGILFGYLPAKKASNLNPIDALRFE